MVAIVILERSMTAKQGACQLGRLPVRPTSGQARVNDSVTETGKMMPPLPNGAVTIAGKILPGGRERAGNGSPIGDGEIHAPVKAGAREQQVRRFRF
ncbi:hypothetical protein [uncultured Sphingomonas sp.]|uniref:hypothetical protein n=1 Tax=uncultured Sphingomonas sp. TaxID=158754 RepID=UPI0025E37A6D|nr:hypothetical protein [uncultured Sphingomonas sp.]